MLSHNWTFEVTTLDKAIKYIDYKKLSLLRGSEMCNIIEGSECYLFPSLYNINVMIAYFKGSPVGWAWVFNKPNRDGSLVRYISFMIYTKPKYRRRGAGRKLMEWGKRIARQRHRRLIVYPWDARSKRFYNSNKIKEENQRKL